MQQVGVEISFFKAHCPPHQLVTIMTSEAGLHNRLLMADSCYTPQPEPRGRCLPVSSYSLGVNFGDVNNWNRPDAVI
jgi:hypothetical protein